MYNGTSDNTLNQNYPFFKLYLDSAIFQRNFTPEEHFMINLCNICDEANAPLDLVDKIVGVVRDAQCNGLNMQSNIICSQEYFLKHLNDCFNTPVPETVYTKIEDQQGNEQNGCYDLT